MHNTKLRNTHTHQIYSYGIDNIFVLPYIVCPPDISVVSRESSSQGQNPCRETVLLSIGSPKALRVFYPGLKYTTDPGCLMSLCLSVTYTDSKADAHHLF